MHPLPLIVLVLGLLAEPGMWLASVYSMCWLCERLHKLSWESGALYQSQYTEGKRNTLWDSSVLMFAFVKHKSPDSLTNAVGNKT